MSRKNASTHCLIRSAHNILEEPRVYARRPFRSMHPILVTQRFSLLTECIDALMVQVVAWHFEETLGMCTPILQVDASVTLSSKTGAKFQQVDLCKGAGRPIASYTSFCCVLIG